MIGDDDLTAIFASGDFDVEAVFTVTAGTVTVRGFFTDASQQVNVLTQEVEAVLPSFTTKTSGIDTVKRGNTVVIDGDTYKVERKEVIGTGVSLVHLKT